MFALALMIISSIVGAGFATGAELITFFGDSTLPPIVISIMVGVFLFLFMIVMIYGQKRKPPDWLVKAISFIFFVAMIAGITELSGPIIAAIAIIVCIIIIWLGFEKALFINKYCMGFTLVVLLLISFAYSGGTLARSNLPPNYINTAFMALLYAAMNCFMLFAVFRSALKKNTRSHVLAAAAIASLLISFFILIIFTAIRSHNISEIMPVLALNDSVFTWLAILLSIFTSMYVAMLNLTSTSTKCPVSIKLIASCIVAYALSFLGFKRIIGMFYPIVGFAMVIYVLTICFLSLKNYLRR